MSAKDVTSTKARLQFFSWSRIAAIGNNPYARLTIIAPVVAPVAVYLANIAAWIDAELGIPVSTGGLPWLYVSLLLFSIAQIFYNICAPPIFKEFRSKIDYANKGIAGKSQSDWNRLAAQLAWSQYYQSEIEIRPVSEEFKRGIPTNENRREQFFLGIEYLHREKGFNEGLLSVYAHCFQQYGKNIFVGPHSKEEIKPLIRTMQLANTVNRNFYQISEDRYELLRREYDLLNTNRKYMRVLILSLYVLGGAWFAIRIVTGIGRNLSMIFPLLIGSE